MALCKKCGKNPVNTQIDNRKNCFDCRNGQYKNPIRGWALKWIHKKKADFKGTDKRNPKPIGNDITVDYMIRMYRKAKKKFPELSFYSDINYPTVDRIDSNKGYVKRNIQIIPKWLNSAKNVHSMEDLNKIIEEYYKTHLEKSNC